LTLRERIVGYCIAIAVAMAVFGPGIYPDITQLAAPIVCSGGDVRVKITATTISTRCFRGSTSVKIGSWMPLVLAIELLAILVPIGWALGTFVFKEREKPLEEDSTER
jgi:hypothetical protein